MDAIAKAISLKKPFERSNTYLLSNNGLFFFRFVNSNFSSKWCGFWNIGTKLVEYFAFKVGDEWLSKENQIAFEYNGIYAKHTYKTKAGIIEEKIALGDSLIIEITAPKRVKITTKFAVNIRKRDENIHGNHYDLLTRGKRLTEKKK